MIRLLVTLNLVLVVVAVLYMLSVNTAVNTLLRSPIENHYQRMGQGTLQLLNEAIAGLSAAQRQQKLAELQQQFVYSLKLRRFSGLDLTEHERGRLLNNLVVKREVLAADYLYGKVADVNELAWEFALDQTRVRDEANTSAGTYFLLQQELAEKPTLAWPAAIAKRQQQFGFPLVLHQPGTLKFSAAEQQQLDSGEILVVIHDNYNETHYQRVGESEYVLQLGVFAAPFLAYSINYIVSAIFLLVIVLASCFWLWPLWRNLTQIKTAAEAFGHGEYDTRVPYHKRSRLAELTHAFNAMAARTQSSIRSHKELTSAVSHELRTPVARMRFSLDMLAESNDPAERQRYLENMNLDIAELDSLLEELLVYARFDQAGKPPKMQWQPLPIWLEQSMERLLPLAGDKRLDWRCEGLESGAVALFEPMLMQRVLNNLVQNALRHARSQVEVRLRREGDDFLLQIDDDGPGIPLHERERLFEAFAVQEDSRNKELTGFGLGLAIVKRIVVGHRGDVIIDDAELGGARFAVRWPVRQEP